MVSNQHAVARAVQTQGGGIDAGRRQRAEQPRPAHRVRRRGAAQCVDEQFLIEQLQRQIGLRAARPRGAAGRRRERQLPEAGIDRARHVAAAGGQVQYARFAHAHALGERQAHMDQKHQHKRNQAEDGGARQVDGYRGQAISGAAAR